MAKTFYTHYVPGIRHLIKEAKASGNEKRIEAAKKLEAKLDEVLNSQNHQWFIGKMDPAKAAARKEAAKEFKARYKKD